jgi:hypothetical protein
VVEPAGWVIIGLNPAARGRREGVRDERGPHGVISVLVLAMAAVGAGALLVTNVIGACAASATIRQRAAVTLVTE